MSEDEDIYDAMLTNVMWWLRAIGLGCLFVSMLYMVGAL